MSRPDPGTPTDSLEARHDAFARAVRACFGATAAIDAITALAGDASSRRYYRLRLHGAAGTPPTAVAMVLGPDRLPLSSEELTVFATPPTELPYVNVGRFLARIGVRIPALYHEAPADDVLLLEDVGDRTLRAAAADADETTVLRLYRAAIDQLVVLQVEGGRHPDPACLAFQQRFDRRLFLWEFDHFLEYGLPAAARPARAALRDAFAPVADRLAAAPVVLAHRDFHSWNLHVQDGTIRVIDFQDALLAPPTYDLASLLTDRDTGAVVSPAREEALVGYYLEARLAHGAAAEGTAELREQYLLCVLQRTLKVIGRFRYLNRVKGKSAHLRYLPHVVAQARRSLLAATDVGALQETLLPHLAGD
jgi:aminoglycoside/choline kinase family phosphotransferase